MFKVLLAALYFVGKSPGLIFQLCSHQLTRVSSEDWHVSQASLMEGAFQSSHDLVIHMIQGKSARASKKLIDNLIVPCMSLSSSPTMQQQRKCESRAGVH